MKIGRRKKEDRNFTDVVEKIMDCVLKELEQIAEKGNLAEKESRFRKELWIKELMTPNKFFVKKISFATLLVYIIRRYTWNKLVLILFILWIYSLYSVSVEKIYIDTNIYIYIYI